MIPENITRGKHTPKPGTDGHLILQDLAGLKPRHAQDLFDSCKPGARNWALRSRIADLRRMGYRIINLRDSGQNAAGIPIPGHIRARYKDDSEAVYLLMPEIAQESPIPAPETQPGAMSRPEPAQAQACHTSAQGTLPGKTQGMLF